MSSIYEQIGGEPAIQTAVEVFYRKVLSDESIAHFFDDVDMDLQLAKQKGFLTMVTGGPHEYTGKSMREGHQHLLERGLNDDHVTTVIKLLGATLTELGVPNELIEQIATVAESVREDILNR
jgi:hemoglobin